MDYVVVHQIFYFTRGLAEPFRTIFSAFPYFNFVQSKVLDDVSLTSKHNPIKIRCILRLRIPLAEFLLLAQKILKSKEKLFKFVLSP